MTVHKLLRSPSGRHRSGCSGGMLFHCRLAVHEVQHDYLSLEIHALSRLAYSIFQLLFVLLSILL